MLPSILGKDYKLTVKTRLGRGCEHAQRPCAMDYKCVKSYVAFERLPAPEVLKLAAPEVSVLLFLGVWLVLCRF
jgi:hypothetical protein